MKNIIKLLAVMIAAVMTLSLLAACSKGPADSTTGAATTAEPAKTTDTDKATEPDTTDDPATEPDNTTEPEETTAAPEVKLYDVYRWDFNDATDLGWIPTNATDIAAQEDGTMKLTCKGGDPNITTKKINAQIDCDNVEYITIRIKNMTDSYSAQLFINTTDSPGPAETYSYKFEWEFADEDAEWEEIEIDTLDINGWTGTLKSLRLDYSDGSEGEAYIDYIALQTTDQSKASVETEEVVDPRAGKELLYKWDMTTLTAEDLYLSSKNKDEDTEAEEGEDEEKEDPRWRFSGGVEDAYVENGHFVIKIGAIDPFLVTPKLTTPFDCSAVSAIVIHACNKTDDVAGQFFFTCEGMDGFSEAGSARFSFEKHGADNEEWEEIVINPKDSQLWEGQLEYVRIDPSESREGFTLIDSIELWGSAE